MRSDGQWRATFSIHLIEDENGEVRVISDWSGKGDRCLALGIDIMETLAVMQPFTDNQLRISLPAQTNIEH